MKNETLNPEPPLRKGHLRAMTLTEMLIVLAILGILVLMAYPVLKSLVTKTRYKEAEAALSTVCTLQKGYHAEKAKYSMELKDIGFEQEKLATDDNGKAHFKIEMVEASNASFLARATAVTDFDGDGQLCVYEVTPDCVPKMIVED